MSCGLYAATGRVSISGVEKNRMRRSVMA